MKQVAKEKYLGDQISCFGLAASVTATIDKRKGIVIQKIFEIKSVIDDCRSHVTGGITTGLDIWEMAVIPFLLNNCDSWIGMDSSAISELDKLQNLFYRVLLEVPTGCPIPMMFWDCGGLLMTNRILKKKLSLLHHIAKLSPDSVANQVYSIQKRLELPGLLQECEEFLTGFEIGNLENYSASQWKTLINKSIWEKNKNDLLENIKRNYKKISFNELCEESFECKPYFRDLNISMARDKFRLRSKMTRTVKFNFPSVKEYKEDLWSCWHCSCIDSQTHIRVCPAYEEFREGKSLDNDQDLVNYFRQVIKLREAMT